MHSVDLRQQRTIFEKNFAMFRYSCPFHIHFLLDRCILPVVRIGHVYSLIQGASSERNIYSVLAYYSRCYCIAPFQSSAYYTFDHVRWDLVPSGPNPIWGGIFVNLIGSMKQYPAFRFCRIPMWLSQQTFSCLMSVRPK